MNPSGSIHSLASSTALPEDIRLKCSYYASEIKTQVDSLYEEQHKWLEDHLLKIKDTMVKSTQKKAGTRAVIAGIIKTPSCKRNKRLSKKTSKLDQSGGPDPFKPPNPSYPLSEFKRSQLNMNSIEIQEIIQQQLQRERNEIESRLQQELSSLNHQYESPAKKSSHGSTFGLADRGNQSPTSLWKPAGSLLPAKSTTTSSLSGPFNSTDARFPPLLPLVTKQSGHPESISKAHHLTFSQQDAEHEQSPVTESRLNAKTVSSTGEQLDVNDIFGPAGHELSAIQEGEEEEDSHAPPLASKSPVLKKVIDHVLDSPIQVQKHPVRTHPPAERSHPPPERSHPPPPERSHLPQDRSHPPPERSHQPPERSHPLPERSLPPPERSHPPPERSHPPPERSHPPPERSHLLPERSHLPPERSHPSSSTPLPPTKSTTPPSQSEIDVPPTQDKSVAPPSQHQASLVSVEKVPLVSENRATSTEPLKRPGFSSESSAAPETNSADAGAFDSDPVAPQSSRSSEPPFTNFSPVVTAQVEPELDAAVSNSQAVKVDAVNAPPSQMPPITYPFALLPSAVLVPGSEGPTSMAAGPPSSENRAVDSMGPGLATPLSPTCAVHLAPISNNGPSSSLTATVFSVKQELEDNVFQSQPDDATHTTGLPQAHVDTVVEVPLNDNPSGFRHNLYASIGPAQSERLADHQTRTPAEPKTSNLFTPGNTRAAIIQSPHSKWSSKTNGVLWTQHKPLKTPASNSNLGTVGQYEMPKSGLSGSPTEDWAKPFSLLSNLQSSTGQQVLVSEPPATSSLTQPISLVDSQDSRRTGLKRTSTDAGFNHTSEAHDAKMSRSHTPGLMNVRTSTTGATGRKGMEDLKSRLSKIQRESAMHERVHHHAPALVTDAPINTNQSTSLVAHNNAPSFPKNLQLSNPLPSLAPLPKAFPIPTTRTINHDQQDNDRAAGVRIHAQTMPRNSTAPVELSASTKGQIAHPITEPINLHGHTFTSEPFKSSRAMSAQPVRAQASAVDQENPRKRNSGHSVSSIVAAYESKANSSETEFPMGTLASIEQPAKAQPSPDIAPLQPTAQIESKHLAFLKRAFPTVNAHPTPSDTTLDGPAKNTVSEAMESHSLHTSPTPEDNVQRHAETDTDEGDQGNCEPLVSDQLPEPTGAISENESGHASNQGNEDHQTHSENEDQGGDSDDDDNRNEDLSVEILSTRSNWNLNKNTQAGLHLSNEAAPNEILPSDRATSELVKTPRNFPTKPSSPTSTGFMGVFKAGAALASSWTTGKPKPELKSLQLAAAAAKKDQDERDRKATLKEERKLMVVEKKRAEEKSKAENERKARLADAEKKKQEREEALKARTGLKTKVPSNHPPSGTRQIPMTEEAAKKRKVDNDSNRILEKKVKAPQPGENHAATKLPSSAQKATSSYLPTRTAPTAPGSAMKPIGSKNPAGSSSTIKQPTQQYKPNPPSRPPSQASQYNAGPGGKNTAAASQLKSSQASQSQSHSVTTTSTTVTKNDQKILRGKMKKTIEKEEYIELPDIDSEYSDDDESEHERKEAKLPDWAQSPALREALANQRKVNPDDVFGGSIPPPRMEEIFRDRASKFRHRTSSANWTGADGLTALEEAEYAKRMGYHSRKKSLKK